MDDSGFYLLVDFALDGFGVSFKEADYSFHNSLVVATNPLFVSPSRSLYGTGSIRGAFSEFASAAAESEVVVRAEFSLVELGRFAASEFEYLSEILEKFF